MRIDAHQHFWKFDPVRDSWITEDMRMLQKDFLPSHLQPLLKEAGFNGCIAVQGDQSEKETDYLLNLANEYSFIKGVVGWVDLQSDDIETRLKHFSQYSLLKGFRHILQGEKDRSLMLTPAFRRGIAVLQRYQYTYDILILPDQLLFAKELIEAFPQQRFVLDHLAKPLIKTGELDTWLSDLTACAVFPNLYCKISGMVTEADWHGWSPSDFTPYLDAVVQCFGIERLMYGSDWPVCLLAASYQQQLAVVQSYFQTFSSEEQEAFFGKTAIQFYQL